MRHGHMKSLSLYSLYSALLVLLMGALPQTTFATDKLVIISPHRKTIQEEFIPAFKVFYQQKYKTDIEVDWLDQGGTSNDIKFLRSKFASKPNTSGIDIFWGGGTSAFLELGRDSLLEKYVLPAGLAKQLPQELGGVPMYDKSQTWYGTAMSSFGIFFNRKLLVIEKLPEPKTWEDLASPKFFSKISLTDPRQSGTANSMNTIVVQSLGWDRGWEVLTAQAGNNRQWTKVSSDPIKAVVAGDATVAPAIDFYALAKIGDLGMDNLGFNLPEGKTVMDPDPAAIVKGAPNRKIAERFMEWVLSAESQKLLVLPKGAEGGPRGESLGRMATNIETYKITEGKRIGAITNPMNTKLAFKLDNDKAAKSKRVFDELVGALLVDTHKELKDAWQRVIKNGAKAEDLTALAKPPVNEAELLKIAEKWDDNVFRNETVNKWVAFAREKYQRVGK